MKSIRSYSRKSLQYKIIFLVLAAWLTGSGTEGLCQQYPDFVHFHAPEKFSAEDTHHETSLISIKTASRSSAFKDFADKALMINAMAGNANLYNQNIYNSALWQTGNHSGWQFEVLFYSLLRPVAGGKLMISYGLGLGAANYGSNLSFGEHRAIYNQIDFSDDPYQRLSVYSNVSETMNVIALEIPLMMEIGNTNYTTSGFYLRFGLKPSIPVATSFSGKGNYRSTGYYQQYGALLEGIPELGFYNNKALYTGGIDHNLNLLDIIGTGSVGFSYPLPGKGFSMIRLGVTAGYGLLGISAKSNLDYTEYPYQMDVNNLMHNNLSPTRNIFLGLELTIKRTHSENNVISF